MFTYNSCGVNLTGCWCFCITFRPCSSEISQFTPHLLTSFLEQTISFILRHLVLQCCIVFLENINKIIIYFFIEQRINNYFLTLKFGPPYMPFGQWKAIVPRQGLVGSPLFLTSGSPVTISAGPELRSGRFLAWACICINCTMKKIL